MTAIFNPTLCAELVAEMREDIAKSSPVPWEASRVPMPPSIVCVRITDEHGEQVADCHDIKPWDNRRPTANASAIARMRNRLATVAKQLEAAGAEVERMRALNGEWAESAQASLRDADALRADNERMRAVVDAAKAWHLEHNRNNGRHMCCDATVNLFDAVDAALAERKPDGGR